MEVLFNIQPKISFPFHLEDHSSTIDQGFASHIKDFGEDTVLVFRDVDDHADGNGLVAIWLVSGAGTFYQDDGRVSIRAGDVLFFDDRIEHGFSSTDLCVAVNFPLDSKTDKSELYKYIRTLNS